VEKVVPKANGHAVIVLQAIVLQVIVLQAIVLQAIVLQENAAIVKAIVLSVHQWKNKRSADYL